MSKTNKNLRILARYYVYKHGTLYLKFHLTCSILIIGQKNVFIILRRIIYNLESKIFLSNGSFSYPMFANCVHAQHDVARKSSRFGEIKSADISEIAQIVAIAETADIPDIFEIAEIAKIAGQDCRDSQNCRDYRPRLLEMPVLLRLPVEIA